MKFEFSFFNDCKNEIFLQSLKNENSNFTWKKTFDAIQNLSLFLDQYITTNDRSMLISENPPEWLISDISIIVSDATQLKKINTIIKKHSFIKKVISFENIKDKNVTFIEEIFNQTYKQEKNL